MILIFSKTIWQPTVKFCCLPWGSCFTDVALEHPAITQGNWASKLSNLRFLLMEGFLSLSDCCHRLPTHIIVPPFYCVLLSSLRAFAHNCLLTFNNTLRFGRLKLSLLSRRGNWNEQGLNALPNYYNKNETEVYQGFIASDTLLRTLLTSVFGELWII